MGLLVAIDTGLRRSGFAVFDDGRLVLGTLVRNPELTARGPRAWDAMTEAVLAAYPLAADTLVVEIMQYDSRTARGAAADVFELVGVGSRLLGAFAGRVGSALAVTPNEWKGGSVPKEVTRARAMKQLSAEEVAAIEDLDDKDIMDAVCIGLWAVTSSGERAKLNSEVAA